MTRHETIPLKALVVDWGFFALKIINLTINKIYYFISTIVYRKEFIRMSLFYTRIFKFGAYIIKYSPE